MESLKKMFGGRCPEGFLDKFKLGKHYQDFESLTADNDDMGGVVTESKAFCQSKAYQTMYGRRIHILKDAKIPIATNKWVSIIH